jgi:protein phosphatase 4 regulatory subunit 3
MNHSPKVYELVGSRWVDQGTALCFGHINANNVAYLTARSEKDFDQIILSTAIRASDVYQRQQG